MGEPHERLYQLDSAEGVLDVVRAALILQAAKIVVLPQVVRGSVEGWDVSVYLPPDYEDLSA